MPSSALIPIALAMTVAGGTSDAPVSVPIQFEMIAIVAASVSGALTAHEKHLDLIGAVALAVLCSLGGGLIRDVILQVGDVYILKQPLALPIAVFTAGAAFVFPATFQKQDRLIAILDIFAVGLYAATGADKAMIYGYGTSICLMMGFLTAVGGGMLRDVFLGQTPSIFQRGNLYALAALAGDAAYLFLANFGFSHVLGLIACTAITMVLRWASLRFNILSPTEVDLERMARPLRRMTGGRNASRTEQPQRSERALDERRERVQADIEQRRREEAKRARRRSLKRRGKKRAYGG